MKTSYFAGLDVMRAIAALLVVFHHVILTFNREFDQSLPIDFLDQAFTQVVGKRSVHLFFLLSGFLITYLLIQEREKNGKIEILKFYFRRMLRIWPLYFITVIIGFLVLPYCYFHLDFLQVLSYYPELIDELILSNFSQLNFFIFFLPNLALKIFSPVAGAAHLWSIGVEEQFYLFWPLIFLFKNRKIQISLVLCFALMPFSKYLLIRLPHVVSLIDYLPIFPFFWMAIGGLGAYIFISQRSNQPLLNGLYFNLFFVVLIGVFISFFLVKVNDYLFGLVGILIIMILASIKNSVIEKLNVLKSLGKISFGIYIYHPSIIFVVVSFVEFYFPLWNSSVWSILMIFLVIVLLTISISWVSYHYFEKFFIELKDRKFKTLQ